MAQNKNNFQDKTLRQIKLWAWAAAVLPLTALAGLFFVWRFSDGTTLGYVMIAGETIMFGIAVIWWWWAMYILRNLVKQWDTTREKVVEVKETLSELRSAVVDLINPKKDK